MALLMVICIMFAVFLLSIGLIILVRSDTSLGAMHTSNETSRYVAESGVYQYLWQLNQDSHFWQDSPTNPLNSSVCIAVYRDPTDILGYFQLVVVPPSIAIPYVKLRSTGWLAVDNLDPNNPAPPANSMKMASVEVQLSKKEFTNYVDFCNDTVVPTGYGYPGDPGGGDYKATGDVVAGPYKTNGTLRTWGTPEFKSTVEYGTGWQNQTGFPTFDLNPVAGVASPWPKQTGPLTMPSNNTQLKTWADADDAYYATNNPTDPSPHIASFPGRSCIYLHTGIVNGQTVGQFDVIYYDPNYPAALGGPRYVVKRNLGLPPGGVIYVNGAFTTNVLDNTHKWDPSYGNAFVSGNLHGELTIGAANDIYITAYDPTQPFSQSSTNYTGHNGVAGGVTYDQQLTGNSTTDSSNPDLLGLIADYNVRILGSDWPDSNTSNPNWPYPSNADPRLDFQATNTDTTHGDDINPNTAYSIDSANDGQTQPDIAVQAAVMSVNGVFDAEGWNGGAYDANADPHGAQYQGGTYNWLGGTQVKGHLDLTGSYCLQQDGYFAEYTYVQDHGYGENDVYDPRLMYETPPHFLEPLNSGWEIGYWHSIPVVITLSPTILAPASHYSLYSTVITAGGGASPYTYSIANGTLPAGLVLSSAGVLSGTPTQTGTFNFTVAALDQNGFIGNSAYVLVVN
jgi:hypothetical protein